MFFDLLWILRTSEQNICIWIAPVYWSRHVGFSYCAATILQRLRMYVFYQLLVKKGLLVSLIFWKQQVRFHTLEIIDLIVRWTTKNSYRNKNRSAQNTTLKPLFQSSKTRTFWRTTQNLFILALFCTIAYTINKRFRYMWGLRNIKR